MPFEACSSFRFVGVLGLSSYPPGMLEVNSLSASFTMTVGVGRLPVLDRSGVL